MTSETKEKIILMRKSGLSYTDIGRILEMPTDTVRSFCTRNGVEAGERKKEERPDTTRCRECGKEIVQNPKNKPKTFCCAACRVTWWEKHPDASVRKSANKIICPACGKEFFSYGNSKRKYCCHECYIADRFGGCHDGK